MGQSYYMLIASLPHLPHFLRAERLPINPQQLRWRRSALEARDWQDLERSLEFIRVSRSPLTVTDEALYLHLKKVFATIQNEALRDYLDYWIGFRSALAGLRRKKQGLPPPAPEEVCGLGRWNRHLHRHWEKEDFGLSGLYPDIWELRDLVREEDAVEVQRCVYQTYWFRLSRIQDEKPFGFEAVFAYAFKWEILARWLARNAAIATRRFENLIEDIIHEQTIAFP